MDNITSILNKYSDEQGWNDSTKLSICLAYINSQNNKSDIKEMNVRSMDTFEDHLQEYVDDNTIGQYYENEECPDCGEDIPKGTTDGENCVNCGHVFCKPREDD